MNFEVQPSTIKGVLSPAIYQVYDSNFALAGFYYEFKIYAWQGTTTIPATPVATITKLPDVYGGYRAWIDVSKIVSQYISENNLIVGTATPTIGTGACYLAVKARAVWTASASSTITSSTIVCTKGYEYTAEGFNACTTQRVLTNRT